MPVWQPALAEAPMEATLEARGRTEIEHRPWPPPREPWAMRMRWHDLLFMHWAVDVESLRRLIPPPLEIDTYDGRAWLGIVPFHMSNVRMRWTPALPWLSAFGELNIRTYVTAEGKPGVWFFSLDAANRVAVRAARWNWHLPYFDARMHVSCRDGWIEYDSRRTHIGADPVVFSARYRPIEGIMNAERGSLDWWLTARYCFYAADTRGRMYRCEINHPPWPLQAAEAHVRSNTMTSSLGFRLPDTPPLLHFSKLLDVVAWPLEPVHSTRFIATAP
jgi:uncharacterized protein YqjF (DUF2071 family)